MKKNNIYKIITVKKIGNELYSDPNNNIYYQDIKNKKIYLLRDEKKEGLKWYTTTNEGEPSSLISKKNTQFKII